MGNNSVMPSVVFEVDEKKFALSTEHVKSIIKLPEVTSMPNLPDYMRGIISIRGQIVQIMDLRNVLGFNSVYTEIKEFTDLMDQREADHKNWLFRLEESIRNNSSFELATDPHKCAFGKWYDNYTTTNYLMTDLLQKFDEPHKRIHSIAEKCETLKLKGKFDTAKAVIESTRDTDLAQMIKLFSEVKEVYIRSKSELSIILENEKTNCGITVDNVISVEQISTRKFSPGDEELLGIVNQDLITSIGELKNTNSFILMLDDISILNGIRHK